MTVKQLSVFMENREGRMEEVLGILSMNDINIVALSLADATEYGMLRMIVSEPEKAKDVLRKNDIAAQLTDVICIRVPHATGSLYKAMKALLGANVNVEYMYAFANGDDASAVLKTKDITIAVDTLKNNGFDVWSSEEAYSANR